MAEPAPLHIGEGGSCRDSLCTSAALLAGFITRFERKFGLRILLDRIVVQKEAEKLVKALPFESMDALEISGDGWKGLSFRSFRAANYPEHDICASPIEINGYDIVIAEQVFEHLAYPYRAAKNVYASLRPGGYFFISTPFLQQVHNFPIDCSRWTPTGMRYFLEEAGFPLDGTRVGSWGNQIAAKANMRRKTGFLKWPPTYNPIFHSMTYDETFPVQVWALARKPLHGTPVQGLGFALEA